MKYYKKNNNNQINNQMKIKYKNNWLLNILIFGIFNQIYIIN